MESQSLNVLREKYLSFFESKGHLRLNSFPLVPQNDNSLLLINAGMAPMKRYFTGELTPPRKRVTTCQKCIRTPDIERVGKTARHGTFFEMLGNFSFGDYFKSDAIPWAWEFLTQVLEIPAERLYPSVYTDDDEALEIWVKTGVPREKIVKFGKEDNFWEIGAGPCGPCSEIYFDRGEKYGCGKPDCKVGCECDRFIEIWNIVFTQFENDGNGNYTRLAHPNIDTGMGLERLACVMQDVNNLFEVDTIRNVMLKLCQMANVEYHASADKTDVSLRVITDHVRGTMFLISDGVLPSNEGRGYVLRRLLRRAARHGRLLGIDKPFLSELADTAINESCGAYPELAEKRDYIKATISAEEDRFGRTIDAGLGILEKMISGVKERGENKLSGEDIFKLYDTFGFPVDLTREITDENGIDIDENKFNELMRLQKERARNARAAAGDVSWNDGTLAELNKELKTEFVGYTVMSCDTKITAILSDGEAVSQCGAGEALVVLEQTPFYAESGGQVGDHGIITTRNGKFVVSDTKKTHSGQIIHIGHVEQGIIEIGQANAAVDVERRQAIMRNHSSVHMLQAALRSVLGTHVEQAGSYVDEQRLRFDFTHGNALSSEQLKKVESIVNASILGGYSITTRELPIAQAKAEGAMALFGEKYGDIVRVVKMGDFSTELCGGTHLDNTSKAGLFKIVSEASVAAGVRRIEAVTGLAVLNILDNQQAVISNVCDILKVNDSAELSHRVEGVIDELKSTKKSLESLNLSIALKSIADSYDKAESVGELKLIKAKFENTAAETLRNAIDNIKSAHSEAVCLFSALNGGKLLFIAGCGKTAIEKGAHAGNLLKAISSIVGGGGGGRPDSAQSGGKDVSKLDEAMEYANVVLKGQLK